MLNKFEKVNDYKHFLWKRCFHPDAYQGALPELITTDGENVRRIVSQRQLIYVQVFKDADTAEKILERVNETVPGSGALLGYSMFSKSEAVSILHTGDCGEPGWVAYPYISLKNSTIPTLPLRVADVPKCRLVCGAQLRWQSGARFIECALEQRGETFKQTEFGFNIIDHVERVSLLAQAGRSPNHEEVRIVPRKAEVKMDRVDSFRVEMSFPIDEVRIQKYDSGKELTLWFEVVLDSEFLCLPEDWRTFYMSVPVVGINAE